MGAWAAGGAYPAPRAQMGTGTLGTKDATLAAGGSPGTQTTSAEYDGSAWTSTPALAVAKYWSAQAGTTAAAAVFGGVGTPGGTLFSNATEEWNGGSWSVVPGTMPVATIESGACGTQTAALNIMGLTNPATYDMSNLTFEYDGTTWTGGGNNAYYGYVAAGAGTQTAAIKMGGYAQPGPGPYGPAPTTSTTISELYNGTSWTTGPTMLFVQIGDSGGAGTQSDAMIVSGAPGVTSVQRYDGTAFATSPSVSTGRTNAGGGGTSAAAAYMVAGGAHTTPTEQFTDTVAALTAQTVTSS